MKRYIKWLLVIVVILAVLMPLVLKGPDGKPVMSLGDWLPSTDEAIGLVRQAAQAGSELADDSIDLLADQAPNVVADDTSVTSTQVNIDRAPSNLSADSGKMYKWQDENGRWHFSSQKPTNAESVALEDLPEVENVMEAPVEDDTNGSMMGIPGIGDAGDILEKVQRMAAERDQ